ncbi:hypothetical protein ACHAWO_008670 [Cyclotella atomus]|uniref:CYTH domain-containing protein n=1 Tax=Cyclotella atomus TaxID=382360 RepID=A0ABD3N8D2_9STRA
MLMAHLLRALASPPLCTSTCFINSPANINNPRRTLPSFLAPKTVPPYQFRMSSSDRHVPQLSSPQQSELEVEKKFPVPEDPTAFTNLKQTLTSLGFQITHEEEFVDWYFDLPAPNWHFSLNDIWIRYREKKWKMNNNYGWRGVWQVKRRSATDGDGGTGKDNDGMTVYQEYQGAAAKEMILDLLCSIDEESCNIVLDESESTMPGSGYNDVPHLDGAELLVPFSKFKTFRSCWQIIPDFVNDSNNKFVGLKVDIDRTDIGYAVGEVEAIFESNSNDGEVELQKKKIRELVDLLANGGTDEEAMSMGKLEYFLQVNSRQHYEACVKAGVIL